MDPQGLMQMNWMLPKLPTGSATLDAYKAYPGMNSLAPTVMESNIAPTSVIPSWAAGSGTLTAQPNAPTAMSQFLSGMLGGRDADGFNQQGWGGLALGGVSALGNLYMGMKQYGLAKDQLNFQKSSFERNWEASKSTTNSALEDRQKARVASNPGAYESVGSYMGKYGIK
jgi:hypothetical protein